MLKGGELVGIGETLRQARKEGGLSVEEVAEKTKIRGRYLEAIEEENFDLLPGHVYVKGFIRNYARFLGLNPEPLVARFEERYPGERPVVVENFRIKGEAPRIKKETGFRGRPLIYVFIAAVLCLAVFGIYAWQAGALLPRVHNDAQVPGDPGGRDFSGQEAAFPDQPAAPPVPPVLREEAVPKGVSLMLEVVQDSCWMRVVVDGETKFEGELTARQSRSFSGKERIKVKLGNAGAVQVQVNGRNLGYLGGMGEVVKKEFLAVNEG